MATRSTRRRSARGILALGCALLAVGLSLLGCARDIVMLNPATGETTMCPASPLNPWSQQEACVGDHIAQGWRRQE